MKQNFITNKNTDLLQIKNTGKVDKNPPFHLFME